MKSCSYSTPTPVAVVEVGFNAEGRVRATYHGLQDTVPLERRRVASALRSLARNLDAQAAELERLEQS